MTGSNTEPNKAVVSEVFGTAFADRDFTALEKYVHPDYAQHNPMIPGGSEGLRNFIASLPDTARIEDGTIVAEGDLVMAHHPYTGTGLADHPLVAVDVYRFKDGLLVEHWDVVQEEVPAERTANGLPMFTGSRRETA